MMDSKSFLECIELLAQISTKRNELKEFLFSHASRKDGGFNDLFESMPQSDKMKYFNTLKSGSFTKDPNNILLRLKETMKT